MFVQVFETHQVFETANYLALHLPYDLENFTEDVFMHDIYCTKFSERERQRFVFWRHDFVLFNTSDKQKSGMFSQIPPDRLDCLF